ncbi:MAG TPA: hypothetical protein VJ624_09870, partial [Thermodesulfobacteriota bacterium]|nr:hypothetical protein [Thermodesulfobacteriota bacterium]
MIGQVARHGFFITWAKFLRPVIVFSYLIDYKIWQLNPFGFHLTNILFHGLNGMLLFLLIKQYLTLLNFLRPSLYAFLSAALFLVLPCHTESVSWIAGRTDVLAMTFSLGATLCFVQMLTRRSKAIVISFFCFFAIALLSKEAALALPGVWVIFMAAYLAIRRESPTRHHVLMVIGIVVGLFVYFLLRKAVIGQFIGGYGTKFHINLLQVGIINHALKYILRSVLPALPPATERLFHSPLSYLTSGMGIFIIGYFLYRVRKKLASPEGLLFGACVLCFLISLVPVLTISINLFSTESERFLYLPSAFSAVASVLAVFLFFSSQRAAVAAI